MVLVELHAHSLPLAFAPVANEFGSVLVDHDSVAVGKVVLELAHVLLRVDSRLSLHQVFIQRVVVLHEN